MLYQLSYSRVFSGSSDVSELNDEVNGGEKRI